MQSTEITLAIYTVLTIFYRQEVTTSIGTIAT